MTPIVKPEEVSEEIWERVLDGVRWLDVWMMDDWSNRIDLETFAITEDCGCVMGQLVGSFHDAIVFPGMSPVDVAELHGLPVKCLMTMDEAVDRGFHGQPVDEGQAYDANHWRDTEREWMELQLAWEHIIRERQC